MTQPNKPPTPRGDCRILYVSDPSSIALNLLPDPVQPADLRRWVDMLADSGVDTLDQEVFSQGWTCYWRSDKYEYDRRKQHRRFLPMLEAGTQPLDILIEQTQKRGMTFIAGFRVNDNHGHQAKQQGVGIAEFISSHPEWNLTEFPEGDYYRLSEPLDFSFDEVRDFTFGVVQEVVERFDVDGIELCFRDHAYFPFGKGCERMPLMTELVRRIRVMLDERSRAKGRELLLGARVFPTPEECRELGLDVETWIADSLIDYVSPQDGMYSDFNLPYAAWAEMTRASDCRLYPALLPWTSVRARNRLDQIPLSHANCRGLVQTFYGAGADGVSIYNHFCACWHAPFYPQALQIFRELRDPERVAAGSRHYVFDPTWAGCAGFGADGRSSTGAMCWRKIVLSRETQGAAGEYRFSLYEDASRIRPAALLFRGFGLLEDDELDVRLNGKAIPPELIGRTRETDAPQAEWQHTHDVGGRTVKCIQEQARIDFRPEPEPPFSTRWFPVQPAAFAYGENVLEVGLVQSAPGAAGPIVIDEVEVHVQPE